MTGIFTTCVFPGFWRKKYPGKTQRKIHSIAALPRCNPCRFESDGQPRSESRAPGFSHRIRNVQRIRSVLCGLIGEEFCLAPRRAAGLQRSTSHLQPNGEFTRSRPCRAVIHVALSPVGNAAMNPGRRDFPTGFAVFFAVQPAKNSVLRPRRIGARISC